MTFSRLAPPHNALTTSSSCKDFESASEPEYARVDSTHPEGGVVACRAWTDRGTQIGSTFYGLSRIAPAGRVGCHCVFLVCETEMERG